MPPVVRTTPFLACCVPLQAAYMFYTVPGATPLQQLMNDALILAHSTGHDVFNALDIFENEKILKGGRCMISSLSCPAPKCSGSWLLSERRSIALKCWGAQRAASAAEVS